LDQIGPSCFSAHHFSPTIHITLGLGGGVQKPESDHPPARPDQRAVNELAKYVVTLIDPMDAAQAIVMLKDKHAVAKLDTSGPNEMMSCRLWWSDACVHAEPSEAFQKTHSAFARKPGLDLDHARRSVQTAAAYFNPEADLFIAAGSEHVRLGKDYLSPCFTV
jgi:hypothetical protein